MQNQKENRFTILITGLLVLLFAYTGINKLLTHQQFSNQLLQNEYLHSFALPISFALPVVEILTAICLVFERTKPAGLWSAAILMTLFSIYVGGMLLQHKMPLHCTCGGIINAMTWKQHLLFNLLFIALAWATILIQKKHSKRISANKKGVS